MSLGKKSEWFSSSRDCHSAMKVSYETVKQKTKTTPTNASEALNNDK